MWTPTSTWTSSLAWPTCVPATTKSRRWISSRQSSLLAKSSLPLQQPQLWPQVCSCCPAAGLQCCHKPSTCVVQAQLLANIYLYDDVAPVKQVLAGSLDLQGLSTLSQGNLLQPCVTPCCSLSPMQTVPMSIVHSHLIKRLQVMKAPCQKPASNLWVRCCSVHE